MKKYLKSTLLSIIILNTLIGSPQIISARTHNMDRDYFESKGDIVWNISTKKKVIALTFDDGPHPVYTPKILDILKKNNAKATFFIVGENVDKNKDILKRILSEGHEIGNHTFTHPNTHKIAISRLRKEISDTDKAIFNATGEHPKYFRSPGGFFDTEVVNLCNEFGYKFILWSWWQDTKDWRCPGVNKIVKQVLSRPHNGDIILFHDYVMGKSQTPQALEKVLPVLKEMGFEFVTIGNLLELRECNTNSNLEAE